MNCLKTRLRLSVLAMALVLVLLSTSWAHAATIRAGSAPVEVRSHSAPPLQVTLQSVAAVSANDVWAVGYNFTTVIEHWNGSRWRVVPSPSPGAGPDNLFAVRAVSAKDVWAVGSYRVPRGINQALIEHWDGSSWKVAPSPTVGGSQLSGLAVISVNDIWAVGNHVARHGYGTLTEHWDGTAWSLVPSPSIHKQSNNLGSIAQVPGTRQVWAVGYSNYVPLIEQWDGRHWKIVNSPTPFDSGLNGVVSLAASDVWASGFNGYATLIEHWNGSTWSIVSSPSPRAGPDVLGDIAAVAANDIWTVGFATDCGSCPFYTLIERWNGSTWSVVPSPNPAYDNVLHGVGIVSASDIWAVGYDQNPGNLPNSLIEHWNGSTWSVVKSQDGK